MRTPAAGIAAFLGISLIVACSKGETVIDGFGQGAWKLRMVNRTATRIGERGGVRLSGGPGNGVAWAQGTDFQSGTIEVDIRGRESLRQTFVGVAFHRKDDNTYEAVYLRPFNFRASDPTRRQHAVQYITLPQFDYDRLRIDFPEEFETPWTHRSSPRTGSSSASSFKAGTFRSTSVLSRWPRSKFGSLASCMVARSDSGWATIAAGTLPISLLRPQNKNGNALELGLDRVAVSQVSCSLGSGSCKRHVQPITHRRTGTNVPRSTRGLARCHCSL